MKISNILTSYKVYDQKPAVSGKKAQPQKEKDNFNVSNEAREFQTVFKAVASSPDVRMDKVNSLKKSIDNGTYNVDAEKIADKIISKYF